MTMIGSSTAAFYDRSATSMTSLTAQADKLSTQISTTKKNGLPSDDVVAYQTLARIRTAGANDAAYAGNIKAAQATLAAGDTALNAITAQLTNASQLAVQARNGTLNTADRQAIASQIDQIVTQLTTLANGKDANGQPLFGDANGGAAVTTSASGSVTLARTTPSAIPIGDGDAVQANESAQRVFALPGGGNAIDMLAQLSAALKGNGDPSAAVAGAITDIGKAIDTVSSVQASLGARAARVDLAASQLKDVAADRETARSAIEDTDVTQAITDLQKTMTILSATQASFSKLSSLSLFDYLR